MKRTLTITLTAVFALALVELGVTSACNKSTPKPSPQGEAAAAAKATQSSLQLTFATEPPTPLDGKDVILKVHVSDQVGKPVPDAQLHGTLTMTTMDMGKNEFDFTAKGNGDYEATTQPSMAGPWEVKITAKRGADMAEKIFPIVVKE
jgi:nitrogen fixation protein FixH